MKRHACIWAIVAGLVVGSWTPAAAQSAGEGWEVLVVPYLMGAAESGTTIVHGRELEVDMSASDIFENLQFGFMGLVVAKKGNWGFGVDLVWMALGNTVRNTNLDFNQGAFAFYGIRELGPAADLTFGVRVNTVQGELTFKDLDLVVGDDKTWVDPIVGLALRTPAGRALQLRLYSEIGGFGMGSDFAWQIFPVLGINFTDSFSLELGYRWLDLDYSEGEGIDQFTWDVLAQGPVIGFGFRF